MDPILTDLTGIAAFQDVIVAGGAQVDFLKGRFSVFKRIQLVIFYARRLCTSGLFLTRIVEGKAHKIFLI